MQRLKRQLLFNHQRGIRSLWHHERAGAQRNPKGCLWFCLLAALQVGIMEEETHVYHSGEEQDCDTRVELGWLREEVIGDETASVRWKSTLLGAAVGTLGSGTLLVTHSLVQ